MDDDSDISSWTQRYLSIIPEKLTAQDVKTILELIEEDGDRFMTALETFVANHEDELRVDA